MALIIADRIKETSTTTGTGALTLAGAIAGYRAFSSVMTSPSDTCYYTIQAVDGAGYPTGDWEVGLGTYSAASTLTRTTILSSSTGSVINLAAGTKQVWIDLAAATVGGPAFSAYKSSGTQSVTSGVETKVVLDAELYDTNSNFDSVTNSRFQPTVAGYYQINASVGIGANAGTLTLSYSALYKNGAPLVYGSAWQGTSTNATSTISYLIYLNGSTDYVELFALGSGTNITFYAGNNSNGFSGFLARPA